MNIGLLVSIITIVGTLILCGVIVWFVISRTKKQAYSGTVVEKKEEERSGANDNDYTAYILVVKAEEGTKRNVNVGKKLWEQFAVGDKIVKEAGKFNPTKA